ncbi:glycogen debranching enzyme [Nakamurella sp. UYEF19]|uniref:amylo-alpha-1,6-glucosidase n=1 Tax=Nakamurella sp. UYEF19 TaxID=1756392 RepID=UPI003399E730
MTCVSAPTVVLSGPDGQIRPQGAQGVFSADIRVLGRAEVRVAGLDLEPIGTSPVGAATVEFVSVIRPPELPTADPTIWLRRRRTAVSDGVDEEMELVNVSTSTVDVVLELHLATDLLDMESVKAGRSGSAARPTPAPGGLRFNSVWVDAVLTSTDADTEILADGAVLRWRRTVGPRSSGLAAWTLRVRDSGAVVSAADPSAGFLAPVIVSSDRRIRRMIEQAVGDLRGLRMTTPCTPTDEFLAAGSPWYLTLFGRDSIWAARMLLPLGTELAAGTLRTLAFRQGTVEDTVTAEEPGKILHEIRRPLGDLADPFLPPVYYGTVDATPLWVCLLADAWRWGLAAGEVEQLLPAAEHALEWMARYGDSDGDGFLEYVDKSGRGLANQGWKDSGDSVRFADGRLAVGPVALAEVQSYAYEAALAGADLLDAFGRPGGQRWRDHAAALAARFREKFWATDELGAYPVLALDGGKNQVDAPASNMGHLLASGILSDAEAALVAARLVHPTMSSGFGLRTMSSTAGGYSPLSYHCGSVWPHDTAIAIHGLRRAGFTDEAMVLAEGLLAAGDAFDGRLPELYGGFSMKEFPVPVPYPASCRPQAWSAASAVVLLQTYLGLDVDVPGGTVRISPAEGIGSLSVSGLQIAGSAFDVEVASGRGDLVTSTDADLRIEVG